jgi:DNA modification methylase
VSVAWDDALIWLPTLGDGSARAVIFDPPYAVGTPVRGREDGAAGSVFGPLSFMSRALRQVTRILMPGGICLIFADWRRMADLAYVASTVGLRPATTVAWTRNRPGTGGLLRAAWDPILVVARGVPDAIDRAAIPNVVRADYELPRKHPYGKPAEVYRHILQRVIRPGDLVVDPFAGSRSSERAAVDLGGQWLGCDIDPLWTDYPSMEASA